MTSSDIISSLNILATVIAVIAAPIIALRVSGKLQQRENSRRQKLELLGVLLSFRHQPLAPEIFRALNMIDAVFTDSAPVRDAWTRYLAALNDVSLNSDPGYSIREEKRRDLMLAIIRDLGLQNKISTTDLLRAYSPAAITEIEILAIWQRIKLRHDLRAEFMEKGIGFPDYVPPIYPVQPSQPQPPNAGLNPPAE